MFLNFFKKNGVLIYCDFDFFSKKRFFSCFFYILWHHMLIEKTKKSCFYLFFGISSYSIWPHIFAKKSTFFTFFTAWWNWNSYLVNGLGAFFLSSCQSCPLVTSFIGITRKPENSYNWTSQLWGCNALLMLLNI